MKQRVMKTITLRMPQAFSRFAGDRLGVSAVEFAIVAPIMIGLYLGCVELASGIAAQRKVSLISSTLANLTSQVNTISTSNMTDMLTASTAIIAPFSATNLSVTLSCLKIDANGAVTVAWSATQNGSARSTGSTVSIPSTLVVKSSQLLFAEASYAYTPTIAYTITGTLKLSDYMYMRPRISTPIYNNIACT
jgi:Flp pilus assembly protein TadG